GQLARACTAETVGYCLPPWTAQCCCERPPLRVQRFNLVHTLRCRKRASRAAHTSLEILTRFPLLKAPALPISLLAWRATRGSRARIQLGCFPGLPCGAHLYGVGRLLGPFSEPPPGVPGADTPRPLLFLPLLGSRRRRPVRSSAAA